MTNTNWADVVVGQLVCADIAPKQRWGFIDFQIQGVVVKRFANGALMVSGCKDERDPFGIRTNTPGYFVVSAPLYVISVIDVPGLGSLEEWEK